MKGTISITLEGASLEQTERCRQIMVLLFQQGIFNIRNGKVTIHFDHEGTLQQIEMDVVKWRRNKPEIPIAKMLEHAKIEVTKN